MDNRHQPVLSVLATVVKGASAVSFTGATAHNRGLNMSFAKTNQTRNQKPEYKSENKVVVRPSPVNTLQLRIYLGSEKDPCTKREVQK